MRTKTSKNLKNTQIILKNNKKMIVNDGLFEFWWGQSPSVGTRFITSFRTTFIFYASTFDFSIKSYNRLKFCHAIFL